PALRRAVRGQARVLRTADGARRLSVYIGGRGLGPLDGVEEMHGDVLHDDVVAAVFLHTVVDHDVAVRTRDGDAFGAGVQQLARTRGVDLGADLLLHPHSGAAGAAAHARGAAARGLDDVDALEVAEHLAGGEVHVV